MNDSGKLGMIVPLYSYPGQAWALLVLQKQANPGVPVVAVIDPSNGPGRSFDSNYSSWIKRLQAAGITVLGYVYTSRGGRSIGSIETDIDTYKNWYHVNGIFFDEMSTIRGYEAYYLTLKFYTKVLGMTFTVGNPGTVAPDSFLGTFDSLVVYEDAALPDVSWILQQYPHHRTGDLSLIAYAAPEPTQAYMSGVSKGMAFVFFSNATDPYTNLPSYLPGEFSMLKVASASH